MEKLKRYYPYIVAVVLFIVIPMIYFAPQYQGFDIRKFDNVQAEGMTAPIIEHQETYGEHPYWAANMFGGMPSYAIHYDPPTDVFKSAATSLYFMGEPAAFYFLLMAGFFFMLLCFGVNPWISIIGSIAYGFSTYFIIIYEAGHIMKLVAMCYVAPMIGALFYTYRKSYLIGAPLFGVFALLLISSAHPQIFYYFIIAMLIMVGTYAFKAYKDKLLRDFFIRSGALVVTTMLAVGANIMYIYYTSDYSSESTRGGKSITAEGKSVNVGLDKDYITSWSYGKMESFNLFIPNLMGGKSSGGFSEDGEVAQSLKRFNISAKEASSIVNQLPAYWGPQPMTSGPVYIGAVMVFLFVLGLFIVRGTNLWWIVGATALSLLLAWGKYFMPLTDLFIDYFPLYDKFRTVSMILVVAQLTIPLMAMLALSAIYKGEVNDDRLKTSLNKALYICGGVAVAFMLFGGTMFNFSSPSDGSMGLPNEVVEAMRSERLQMLRADAIRSLVFVLLTYGVILFWKQRKIKGGLTVAALVLLVAADMIPVAVRHISYDMFQTPSQSADKTAMTEIDKQILKDSDINYRVANLSRSTFNDATTSIYHRSIGGYFAAKPRYYQDIINRYLSKMYMPIYNMLNTKYFIAPEEGKGDVLHVNGEAFGNAWVAGEIATVNGRGEELEEIGNVDLKRVAVIDEEFVDMLGDVEFDINKNDMISHTSYKANRMEYKVSLAGKRLIIFSEVYYPKGWTAYIDGKEAPYLRANYILNGIVVPEGEHTIVFEFKPPHLSTMRIIQVMSSVVLLLLLVGGGYLYYKRREV